MLEPNVCLKTNLNTALYTMAFAAKLCYGKEQDVLTDEQQQELLARVLKSRHFSILEHASASFYISDVSRNFTHQLVRHRHMSFAQQSFHYTVATEKQIPYDETQNMVVQDLMEESFMASFKYYQELIGLGVPKEQARHVLPSGICTKIIATANLREWMQFVQIRSCAVNCMEIRIVASRIREILSGKLPVLAPYLGPMCTIDKCHEGKKSCGGKWRLPQ